MELRIFAHLAAGDKGPFKIGFLNTCLHRAHLLSGPKQWTPLNGEKQQAASISSLRATRFPLLAASQSAVAFCDSKLHVVPISRGDCQGEFEGLGVTNLCFPGVGFWVSGLRECRL